MQSQGKEVVQEGKYFAYLVCFVAAVGGFLFGYDLVIISGAQIYLKEQFNLSDAAFGFATSSAILGCIIGPFIGSWMCDRFGRKNVMIFSALLFAVSAIGSAVPKTMFIFNTFRIIGGVAVGLCSIASPMYIAELAPARIRGGLGFMYQLAIAVGALASGIVAWLLAKYLPETISWRWMFASELLPIIAFSVLLIFIPRSPRWLSEMGRFDEAREVLTRIEGPEYAERELADIKESLMQESGTFSELFQPGIRKALLVGILLAIFNNTTGWTEMGYYLPTLFKQGGFPDTADAIFQFLIISGFGSAMTLIASLFVDRLGRRPLWLICSAAMIVSLTIVGLVFYWNLKGPFVFVAIFLCAAPHAFALGPLPWLMMSELYPTRIRARAVAITTTVIWIAGWFGPFIFPIIAGWFERNTGSIAPTFWLLACVCVLSLLFGWKLMPETKGRTLEEIARSWHK